MTTRARRAMRWALAVLALVGTVARPGAAAPPISRGADGLALGGHDAVAYFAQGRPVRGRPEFTFAWKGATWRFASADNRDAFARDPERYAPKYGGYCAYAAARGYTAPTDPSAWRIVEGRLYLNFSKSIQGLWEEDIPSHIARADKNWPAILAE